MCSNGSGCGTTEDLMPEEPKIDLKEDKLCPRCNINVGEVVLRSKDIYCKPCLLHYLNHKFRAALGKSKLMRPQDKALIAFSGSHSSMSLLHLMHEGMQLSSHKRILFSVCVVYIDDGSVAKLSISERRKLNSAVEASMSKFEHYFMCIEQSLEAHQHATLYSSAEELPLDKYTEEDGGELNKLFETVTTLSSRQYLLQTLRQNLLTQAAKKLNCTKIFTAETQTDLATKIIANIALGKGAHVPLDVGFSDDRTGDLITLRPLRDFSSKEVIYYNLFNDLAAIHVPSLATLAEPLGSLQKAAESFVSDLQTNFPSTVSTVFRTADKLSLDFSSLDPAKNCALCKAPLDTRSDLASSSMGATKFSRLVSNATREELNAIQVTSSDDVTSQATSTGSEGLQSGLCYACQYVIKDMKSSQEGVGEEILKKTLEEESVTAMENQIKDFIL
uniref:Cytoplasmic tRNA 2-thiolation protein 2 n=1 Tax=Cacopsylla melanoneura TaxID=428564 RepID=A0A8D8XG35_9HEMI